MATRDKTTIMLDRKLTREAGSILGTTKTTETINEALAYIVREQKLRELAEVSIRTSRELGPKHLSSLRDEAWRRSAQST